MSSAKGMSAEPLYEVARSEISSVIGDDIIGQPGQTNKPLNKAWHSMSGDERLIVYVAIDQVALRVCRDLEAAARADERVKAWNEALMTLAKKECLGCGAGEIPVWTVMRPSLPKFLRHPFPEGGHQSCTASDIQVHRLPEAQPVEPSEGEGT